MPGGENLQFLGISSQRKYPEKKFTGVANQPFCISSHRTIMDRQQSRVKPPNNDSLPPCQVCGERGCGFHYGVTTCDACKGFFRRSLVRKEPYVCLKSDLCHVGPSTNRRQSCPKCRYDKCVALGMSLQACKVGRYSKLKKSKNMMEVMEHKRKLESGIVCCTKSSIDDIGDEYSRVSKKHSLSRRPKDDLIHNCSYVSKHVSNVTSTNEETMWNCGDQRGIPQRCTRDASSDNFSYDRLNGHEGRRIEEYNNDSSSMFSEGLNVKSPINMHSTQIDDDDDDENKTHRGISNSSSDIKQIPYSFDTNTHETSRLLYSGYNSYLNLGSVNEYSPPSTPNVPVSYSNVPRQSSNVHPTLPLESSPEQTEAAGAKYQLSNYPGHVPEPYQLVSPFAPENESGIHWDQHMAAQMNDGSKNGYSQKSVYAQNWPPQTGCYRPYASGMHDTLCTANNNSSNSHNTVIEHVGSSLDKIRRCGPKKELDEGTYRDGDFAKSQTSNELHTSFVSQSSGPSNTVKRPMNIINEKEDNPKKRRNCVKTMTEPEVVQNESISYVSKSVQASFDKPTFLLCVTPNMSNYTLSVFQQFPFKSYELESLSSILKNCYQLKVDPTTGYKITEYPKDYSVISKLLDDTDVTSNPATNTVLASTVPQEGRNETLALTHFDEHKMDDLFSYLMDIQQLYFKSDLLSMTDLEMKTAQDTFWGLCQLKEMVHGKMNFINEKTYFAILEATCIDVDKRKELLMSMISPLEGYTWKKIKFFNSMPGFSDFTLADKITLIKSCSHMYYILTRHRGIDTNKHIAIDEETRSAYRFCHLQNMFPTNNELIADLYDSANDLKQLALSLEEIVILKAIVLTNPDTEDMLEQPEIVEKCNKTYTKCLLNLMRKRYGPQADNRFADILQTVNHVNNKTKHARRNGLDDVMDVAFRIVDTREVALTKESFVFNRKHGGKVIRSNTDSKDVKSTMYTTKATSPSPQKTIMEN